MMRQVSQRRLCQIARGRSSLLTKAASKTVGASSEFYEMRERSLLAHVLAASNEGNPDSVLSAMDEFWDTYFNQEGTAEWKLRGDKIDEAVSAYKGGQPAFMMELGTYCGYTAVRMGRMLPPGGKLVSVEIDPLFAAIATKVVEHAGLRDAVSVEIGELPTKLDAIKRKHGAAALDVLLMDHKASEYLRDLQLLEQNAMIARQTRVLCDWTLYPGDVSGGSETQQAMSSAPQEAIEFIKYLRAAGEHELHTVRHSVGEKDLLSVSSWSGAV